MKTSDDELAPARGVMWGIVLGLPIWIGIIAVLVVASAR